VVLLPLDGLSISPSMPIIDLWDLPALRKKKGKGGGRQFSDSARASSLAARRKGSAAGGGGKGGDKGKGGAGGGGADAKAGAGGGGAQAKTPTVGTPTGGGGVTFRPKPPAERVGLPTKSNTPKSRRAEARAVQREAVARRASGGTGGSNAGKKGELPPPTAKESRGRTPAFAQRLANERIAGRIAKGGKTGFECPRKLRGWS